MYFTVRLTGGKFVATKTPAFGDFTFGGVTCITEVTDLSTNLNPSCAATLSTDLTTFQVKVTSISTVTTTLGLGALIWRPAAGSIDNVNTTLATAGGVVTASIGVVTAAPASGDLQSTVAQSTIDSPLATGTIAASKSAITASAGTSAYAGKIDLTASPAGSSFTTTNTTGDKLPYAILGTYKFTDVASSTAGTAKTQSTPYTLAKGSQETVNTGATVTITPTVGVFPIGSVMALNTAADCQSATAVGATTGSGAVAFTTATQGTAKTLSTTTAVTTGTDYFVCLTKPSTGNTAAPLTATISAVVKPASGIDLIATASATGYALSYNGSTIDTNAFWGSAVSAAGYSSYVRVINTGSVAAAVSMAYIDPTTGAAGTSAVVITSLAAGTSKMLTAKEIETAVGASPFGYSAGRLRVTAPTNGMKTQSFLQTATGAPQEVSGAQ
jgi:hypothetical protein